MRWIHAITITILVSSIGAGCKKQSSVEVMITPGAEALIDVTGDSLEVKLRNEGPGGVLAAWDSTDDTKDVEITLSGKGYYKFDFPGSVRITAKTTGDTATRIKVAASGATGVSATVTPVGDQRDDSLDESSSEVEPSSSESSSEPPGR